MPTMYDLQTHKQDFLEMLMPFSVENNKEDGAFIDYKPTNRNLQNLPY